MGTVVDYFYVHEKVPFAYRVSVQPPPATVSKVEFHAQTPEGRILHSDQNLAKTGSSTVQFDPKGHGATVADSPVFAVFRFEGRAPAPPAGSTLGIPLAEPGIRKIDAPKTAKVGDHVKLKVSEWCAFIYDHPSTGREDAEPNSARIDPRAKSGVKWKVDGHDLPSRGQEVTLTIEQRHEDKELEVEASLPPQLGVGRATAKIKVPKLAVTKLELRGPDAKPAKQFAPGKDEMTIHYEIKDKLKVATEVKLEIFRSVDGQLKMDAPIWTKVLKEDERADGTHDMPWKGEIKGHTGCGDFPADEPHVSVEYSPYKLRISAKGEEVEARPDKQEVQFEVKFKAFKIELAPKSHLKEKVDKDIYDAIGVLPSGSPLQLHLESNIFAIKSDDMEDNTGWLKYHELVGEGPRIPILATATVLDYKNQEVRAGKALGCARVLWDYTDPPPSERAYATDPGVPNHNPSPFVENAQEIDKEKTRPKNGQNAHVLLGGKRTSTAGCSPVMAPPDGGVQSFPFKVKPGEKRFWAGFSEFARGGDHDAQAGVVFRPAPTAGDNYKVKAYLDFGHKLDADDDTPQGAKADAEVGEFEIWREVKIVQHYKKCDAITEPWPNITTSFDEAYMAMTYDTAPKSLTKAEYDALFTAALPKVTDYDLLKKYAVPAGSQYDMPILPGSVGASANNPAPAVPAAGPATTWVASFYGYGAFRRRMQDDGVRLTDLYPMINEAGLGSEDLYAGQLQSFAGAIAEEMCKTLIERNPKQGLVVLQFTGVFSFESKCKTQTVGSASFLTRHRAGFKFYSSDGPTAAHEIGHVLFLPHAPFPSPDKKFPAGSQPHRHEKSDDGCLMSYSSTTPGFCGICLLRLRGWNAEHFDENGPKLDIQ